MQIKLIAGAIVVVALLIVMAVYSGGDSRSGGNELGTGWAGGGAPRIEQEGRATVEGDRQYIDITARGGYSPRKVVATAGMPTTLRMKTENTFDCSMALVIPALKYQSYLEPSGDEEIEIPPELAQGTLEGLCSMAMYRFEVVFE